MGRIFLAAALGIFVGCQDPLGARLERWIPDAHSILAAEEFSGIDAATRVAVQDSTVWRRVWRDVYRGSGSEPPLPTIDFRAQTVLLAGLGWRPSGGFAITIDSLVRYEGGSIAYLTEWSPGEGCVVIDAETAPVHVIVTAERVVVRDWRVWRRVTNCA